MDKFNQLKQDLIDGEINLLHIQIAYRSFIRQNKDIPIEAKSILCGNGEADIGLIGRYFKLIDSIVGAFELAIRRAKDN